MVRTRKQCMPIVQSQVLFKKNKSCKQFSSRVIQSFSILHFSSIPFKDIISARVNRNMLHLVIENFPEKNLLLSPDQSEITAASSPSEEQTLSEVTLQFISTEQCWHVYRALTERIVFYSRQRATDIETPHFKCRWHSFVAKVGCWVIIVHLCIDYRID